MNVRAAGALPALVLLLALPAAAAADPAPGVCEYDGVDTVSYTWPVEGSTTTDLPAVQRYGAGDEEISVGLGGRDCGAATVNNTRLIQIVGTPPPSTNTRDDIAILLHNGVLEPSSDPAAGEVKIQLVNPGRQIRLRIGGSPRADHITAGAGGVNLNSDEAVKDVDVTVKDTGSYLPVTINCVDELCSPSIDPGSAGNDVIGTAGGAATGAPITGGFVSGIWILGGPGADTLTVDRYGSVDGGPGDDTMTGISPVGVPFAESRLSYGQAPGLVTVDLAAGTATGAAGSDTFSGFADVSSGPFADLLLGDEGPNQLAGDFSAARPTPPTRSAGAAVRTGSRAEAATTRWKAGRATTACKATRGATRCSARTATTPWWARSALRRPATTWWTAGPATTSSTAASAPTRSPAAPVATSCGSTT